LQELKQYTQNVKNEDFFRQKKEKHKHSHKNMYKKHWLIIYIICATVAVSAALWFLFAANSEDQVAGDDIRQHTEPDLSPQPVTTREPQSEPETASETDSESDGVRDTDREIDFEGYFARNPDFFAWLYVPGTQIDYPVVKSHDNADYMRHDLDGNFFVGGTVFMDMGNRVDLSDRITVLHGHNMRDGTKFADLHNFKDPEFFAQNREMRLYTPDGVRIYEIIAVYIRDDRNILYMVDYSIDAVWEAYIEEIFSNTDESANLFRIETGPGDHMLTLNTCVEGQYHKRLLVQGILRKHD
jgi:sortase B